MSIASISEAIAAAASLGASAPLGTERRGDTVREKREVLERLLHRSAATRCGPVAVHFDSRARGVQVPEVHRGKAHLTIKLSLRFERPEIQLTDELLRCTLSFGGQRFRCAIPWGALWALGLGAEGKVWPDSVPPEAADKVSLELECERAEQQPVQEHQLARCPQCAQMWSERACGPTHAIIAEERRRAAPAQRPLIEVVRG